MEPIRVGAKWMILMLAALMALVSCGSPHTIPEEDSRRMEELGNQFVEELQSIIPLRESPELLQTLDAIVVIQDKTYGVSRLDAFYQDYKVGQNAELIMVFNSKSFVVSKVMFEGTSGYYFRYEYDPLDETAIQVTGKPIDRIAIEEAPAGSAQKVTLSLKREKTSDITFTFRNIVEEQFV